MTPTRECLYCDHRPDNPGDCCLWQQKGEPMTSRHEETSYAQQGDRDEWDDLPANGEGWDKPQTVDPEGMGREELSRQYKLRCNELIDATGIRLELVRQIAALRAERDEARRERDDVISEMQRLQPDGSPPPGGPQLLAQWIMVSVAKQLAAAVERERGMREAMELIAQQDCKTYETWQAGVEWMQEHARKALAAPPVDNQPAAGGERMECDAE